MHPSTFMAELAGRRPDDVVVFDEALTSSPELTHHLPPSRPGHYFCTRGGSLGVGFPGAIGVKLAMPDKTVIGFSGDGGAMYTIQAMWTAAHHDIGAKFVVCNNRSYQLLKLNIEQLLEGAGHRRARLSAQLRPVAPADHVRRARPQAMASPRSAWRNRGKSNPRSGRCSRQPGPFLIDLVVEGNTHPERVGNTCGQ